MKYLFLKRVGFILAGLTLSACSDNEPQQPPAPPSSESTAVSTEPATHVGAPKKDSKPASKNNSSSEPVSGITAELLKTHPPRNPIEKARNSTVFIETGFGQGSGFFIDSTCTVITNRHVIQLDFDNMRKIDRDILDIEAKLKHGIHGSEKRNLAIEALQALKTASTAYLANGLPKKITLTLINDRQIEAKVAAISRDRDLAYLHIKEQGCTALPFEEKGDMPLGTQVYTIGNPVGQKYSVTSGIISGNQLVEGKTYVQTDAAINPGNSGGPLIDEDGNVLGVNTLVLNNAEGIGFAIPAHLVLNDHKALASDLQKFRESGVFTLWEPEEKPIETIEQKETKKRLAKDAVERCVNEFENENWVDALKECRLGAQHEQPQAQYLLATLEYDESDNEAANAAIELYRKSAAAGYAEASYQLGLFRYEGTPTMAKNRDLSKDLLAEACEGKLADACLLMGDLSELSQAYTDAMKYYEQARELGSREAIYSIGSLYELGLGVAKNKETAAKYYEDAAMLGVNVAQYHLFWFYYKGIGVKRSYKQAYTWAMVSGRDEPEELHGWTNETPDQARFLCKNC